MSILNLRLFVCVFFLIVCPYTFANNCWKKHIPDTQVNVIQDTINQSDLIFVGEVNSVIKRTLHEVGAEEKILEILTDFKIIDVLKGDDVSSLSVSGEKSGGCGCKYNFYPGVRYLVLAKKINGINVTYHCDHIKPIETSLYEEFRSKLEADK